MITMNNLSFEDLKNFVLFETYYQNMTNEDLSEEIKFAINLLMDYHIDKIYGSSKKDVLDAQFQSIIFYEN